MEVSAESSSNKPEITIFLGEDESAIRMSLRMTIGSKVRELILAEGKGKPGERPRSRLVDACAIGFAFTTCDDLFEHIQRLTESGGPRGNYLFLTDYNTPGQKSGADVAKLCLDRGVPFLVYTAAPEVYLTEIKALITEAQYLTAKKRILVKPASTDALRRALETILQEEFPQVLVAREATQQATQGA